jgi:hypothetical protein
VASGEKSKTKVQIENGSGRSLYINIMRANFSTLLQALRRSISLIPFSFIEKTSVFTMLFLLVIPFFIPFSIFSVSTYNTHTANDHLNQLINN